MKVIYNETIDELLIVFSDAKATKTVKIADKSIMALGAQGEHVYLQIWGASKVIDDVRTVVTTTVTVNTPPAGYIEIGDEN